MKIRPFKVNNRFALKMRRLSKVPVNGRHVFVYYQHCHSKEIILSILGLFLTPFLFAQEVPLQKIDKVNNFTDSVKLAASKLGAFDSRQFVDGALRKRITMDTLAPFESLRFSTLKSQLDSLRNIKSPDTIVSEYLISMKAKSDSLQSLLRLPPQTEEAAHLQQQARDELGKVPAMINENLKLFAEQGANVGQLSGFNLPGSGNLEVPGVGPALPSGGVLEGLGGLSNPSTSITSVPGKLSMPAANITSTNILQAGPVPNSKSFSVPSVPDIKAEVPQVGEVKGELGKVNGVAGEAQLHKKNIKAITSGNLDSLDSKSLEASVASFGDVTDQGSEFADDTRHAEMIKKWNSDPQYKKELAVSAAKEQAINHFAGHEEELKASMDQLSKAKGRVKDAEQVIDLFGKPANPMKDKPFIERLRPGINLQVQWMQLVLLDMNPYLGYRISGNWTAGLGWNERLGFTNANYAFSSSDRIYGPRAFIHYKLKESHFLILSPELMHSSVPAYTVHSGENTSKWVPGLMAGYRREFRYSKKVVGTIQVLYNLAAPMGQSPYASRFNLMFGFEFPLKKKGVSNPKW